MTLLAVTRWATAWALAGTAFTAVLREVSSFNFAVVACAFDALALTDPDTFEWVVESVWR